MKKLTKTDIATFSVMLLSSFISTALMKWQQKQEIAETVKDVLNEERRQIIEASSTEGGVQA